MLRKLLKIAAGLVIAALVTGGVLYQFFGLRIVMDGGGIASSHVRGVVR